MYTNPPNQQDYQEQPSPQETQLRPTHQVIYQAEPSWTPMMKQKQHAIHAALHPHVGHHIHVQTIDGHTYQGTLVHVDGHHAHIHVHPHGHHPHHGHHLPFVQHPSGQHRPIYSPAAYNQIMTLVLFELLVILLLG
ncbi:hypothetical protein GK047_18510 [Paenibacillus sp. SYP-B3998]|uniref:Uncharacterized protein n=1 Tax=Paenibacillus sp. SYP-B3998 TaxID=2678564 RepID=A0A6G4A0U7_9BACL|nr:hypothetical protein [Paenibacillus sp. SYP-B3998]NEW07995.1 hypothetical protein [Paenibacillus sp. SYP-B3998]